jgi:hypothetical protein
MREQIVNNDSDWSAAMPLYADQIRRQREALNGDMVRLQDEIVALLDEESKIKAKRMELMRKMRALRAASRRKYVKHKAI